MIKNSKYLQLLNVAISQCYIVEKARKHWFKILVRNTGILRIISILTINNTKDI